MISAKVKEVVDPIVGGEKSLHLSRRFEPLNDPLSSSRRLVGILRPVVQALVLAVLNAR
jgi:hypothetical protein